MTDRAQRETSVPIVTADVQHGFDPSWGADVAALEAGDPEIAQVVRDELHRQRTDLQMIASENFTSPAVLAVQGSVFTNKYAEGYPGRRYYEGCEHVDAGEQLAIDRVKALFGAEHANVQPHSGAQANMAAYAALGISPGDRIMGLPLAHGGHLTHGAKPNFTGKWYEVVEYGVQRETERLDYDEIAAIARDRRPHVIVAGYTAYPREIDFAAFRAIADEVGAKLFVDAAHIAGLIAGGAHPSPVPFADVVCFTTHKTLRGPSGGAILCREEYAKAVDRAVFPMMQGKPLAHAVIAKAVAFREASQPDFRDYAAQLVANASALADGLAGEGLRIVTGGTDIHYLLADVTPLDLTGAEAATRLAAAGITVNKNTIPYDPLPPMTGSGVRVGVPSTTTQGMGTREMAEIARLIGRVLKSESEVTAVRDEVHELTARFPAYPAPTAAPGTVIPPAVG